MTKTSLRVAITTLWCVLLGCGNDHSDDAASLLRRLEPWREIHAQVDRAYVVQLGAVLDTEEGRRFPRPIDEEVDGRQVLSRTADFDARRLSELRRLLAASSTFRVGVASAASPPDARCVVLRARERATTLRIDLAAGVLDAGSAGGPPSVRLLLSSEGRSAFGALLGEGDGPGPR